jgi:tetratricopeptide (TPR) repeat protein
VLFYIEQYKKALKILKQLIKLDPNNQQETFNEMGVMYGRINQYNKAKIYYQKSIEKTVMHIASWLFCYF